MPRARLCAYAPSTRCGEATFQLALGDPGKAVLHYPQCETLAGKLGDGDLAFEAASGFLIIHERTAGQDKAPHDVLILEPTATQSIRQRSIAYRHRAISEP